MRSSTKPSAKCACSGSMLIFVKGKTAIDGSGPRAALGMGGRSLVLFDGERSRQTDSQPAGKSRSTLPAGRNSKPPAKRSDLNRKIAFFDVGVRPGGVHQSRLGHHLTASFHQGPQQRQGFASNRDRQAVLEQCAAARRRAERDRMRSAQAPWPIIRLSEKFWDHFGATSGLAPRSRRCCPPRKPSRNRRPLSNAPKELLR